MNKDSRVLVLGGRGLVGSAIVRELTSQKFQNILAPPRQELDLLNQAKVEQYFESKKPEYVFMAAALVGGILANNNQRADFIYQNLAIQSHVFGASFKSKISKMVFLGSSCIYPKMSPQPMKEEYLLTGPLEVTNEPYAIAKIAGLKTAESFRRQYGCRYLSLMPTNLYGPHDNFDPENSHVIPGLMHRMAVAKKRGDKTFSVWGTGKPKREFLFVEDLAKASVFAMEKIEPRDGQDWINVGTGKDISISELVGYLAEIIGYDGKIEYDNSKPDGTPRKLMDVSKINELGWRHKIEIQDGLKRTWEWYLSQNLS
jgi:GDP-L-fucose synthase